MKVSVIVPVYNVEQYIDKCLNSLEKQSLKDLEVIIVNDGTKDNSEAIIKTYLERNKNFKYFKKENGGLSDARNYGINKANGEYIAFLDSDDYILADAYEKMYEKAKNGNFDMVVCDLNYVYPDKIVRAYSNIKNDTTDIKSTFINIYPAAWNKLFKKELFDNNILFKKGVWFEDVEFIYRLLPYVKSIGVIHEPFNQYVQREGSITNTINIKVYDYIGNMNSILEFYHERKLYDFYKNELEYVYVRYLYATFLKTASKYDYQDYLNAVNKAIENVKKQFPKYRRNEYFYKSLKGLYLIIFNKIIAKLFYKLKGRK